MTSLAVFRTMLFVQWKLQRTEILAVTLVAAVIAPVDVWARSGAGVDTSRLMTGLMSSGSLIRTAGALLAISIGALFALRPFLLDSRVQHAYTLALPLTRSRFALTRAATGMMLCLIPAVGFLIGTLVAAQALPDTLLVRKFPVALALRFLLAVATAFAVFFGLQYGLGNRARRWVLISALTVLGVEVFGQFTLRTSVVVPTIEALTGSFSPLRLFLDRWVLFDV
jgi:hypothetical protein